MAADMIQAAAAASDIHWAGIFTSVGTVGAVIVAVGIAVWSDRKTSSRLQDERDAADNRLLRQQEHSDNQLRRQQENSDQQLADERKAADERLQAQMAHSDQQLREERQHAQDALQLSEAYAIRVIVAQQDGRITDPYINADPEDILRSLVVVVVNEGRFTVTDVAVGLYRSDGSRTDPARVERIGDCNRLNSALEDAPSDVVDRALAPGASRLRFTGSARLERDLIGSYPVVRWTDHWGQMWERSKGRVRKTSASTTMTAWP